MKRKLFFRLDEDKDERERIEKIIMMVG